MTLASLAPLDVLYVGYHLVTCTGSPKGTSIKITSATTDQLHFSNVEAKGTF